VAFVGAVLTIDTSAVGVTGVVTVLLLFVGSGSVTPGGKSMVAVLEIDPVAFAATTPLMVITMLAPEGSVGTVPLIVLPTMLKLKGQTAPLSAEPQTTETPEIALGTISLKVVPFAAEGPVLLIRIV
jgi:hypothetical protein